MLAPLNASSLTYNNLLLVSWKANETTSSALASPLRGEYDWIDLDTREASLNYLKLYIVPFVVSNLFI